MPRSNLFRRISRLRPAGVKRAVNRKQRMASGNNIEFRVGVIVLLGVLILVVSLYWLQGYRLEANSQIIRVRFGDVGTLSVGDRVTVSGVRKGKVKRLHLTDNGVEVELQIYQDVRIKRDATFTIKNQGLMGERFVAISSGNDSLAFDTTIVAEGRYDSGIPEVLGHMGEMVTELRSMVRSLKRTVASDSSLERFNRTVANLEHASSSLSGYLERNEHKFEESADNFLSVLARAQRYGYHKQNHRRLGRPALRPRRAGDGSPGSQGSIRFRHRRGDLPTHSRTRTAPCNCWWRTAASTMTFGRPRITSTIS